MINPHLTKGSIMKTATMFMSQLTILDHAYIDDVGVIVGGSFNPDFIVAGDVDPVEQVVVDFSTVKKDLKRIIDAKEDGFDHKLWFIEGFSQGFFEEYEDDAGPRVRITTQATFLDIPRDALKVFEADEYTTGAIGTVIAEHVEVEMRKLYPNIRITCLNNIKAHTPTLDPEDLVSADVDLFTYSHGLKDSTSWGCNNIAHGHLSYVQISPVTPSSLHLQGVIAAALDGVVFINKENVVSKDDSSITLNYTTGRGKFYARYNLDTNYVRVLDTETTIEHIVEYVKDLYLKELKEVGTKFLFVSEGLSKGAVTVL